jgi:hypothetical protein
VYPKFATLAQSHSQLFEEKKISLARTSLFELLIDIRSNFKLTLPQQVIR